jgi:glycosyltransferase involved in cell wall biosynthesis
MGCREKTVNIDRKPKLAIISTHDELCGIASYSRAIVRQLSPWFDITVFDLDQYLFRHQSKRIAKLADAEIERICQAIQTFDCVNIQLEHGIFGRRKTEAYRRICRVIAAAPVLCVTFHTVFESKGADWKAVRSLLGRFQLGKAWNTAVTSRQEGTLLGKRLYRAIVKAQTSKPVSVIVHTRRDARMMRLVEQIQHVYDHPLAYYTGDEARAYAAQVSSTKFPLLKGLKTGDVLLGCFGFTGSYKGIDTALRALHLLPENYHLAIFGGVHPEGIQRGLSIDPYIQELLDLIHPGRSWLDAVENAEDKNVNLTTSADDLLRLARIPHKSDLSERVHFMGPMTDDEFPHAMMVCDVVLLPYLEVGQSASGPMSMAVNLNRPVVATRTKTFLQFSRYFPGRAELFDIGNHLQLSQIIRAGSYARAQLEAHEERFGALSNIATYCKALFAERFLGRSASPVASTTGEAHAT